MFNKLSRTNKILIGSQVLLIIILVMSVRSCNTNQALAELNQYKLDEYLEERQEFVTTINEQGEQIAIQDEVIITKDKKIEKQLLENSQLKKLNRQIKIGFETKLENVIAEYEGKLEDNLISETIHDTIHDTVYTNPIGVKFGTPFSLYDDWYYTAGSIEKNGVLFDSLSFRNDLTITVGRKREGWFKPMETKVEVVSSNPYTRINSLNNIKIQENKDKLINKPWFTFILGTATGFTIGVLSTVK